MRLIKYLHQMQEAVNVLKKFPDFVKTKIGTQDVRFQQVFVFPQPQMNVSIEKRNIKVFAMRFRKLHQCFLHGGRKDVRHGSVLCGVSHKNAPEFGIENFIVFAQTSFKGESADRIGQKLLPAAGPYHDGADGRLVENGM